MQGVSQLVDGIVAGEGRRSRLSQGLFTEPLVCDRELAARFAAATEDLLAPASSLEAAERLSGVLREMFRR
jgi:hypothetical protein